MVEKQISQLKGEKNELLSKKHLALSVDPLIQHPGPVAGI